MNHQSLNLRNTRVLVTGVSGFIGSRLALHLHRLDLDAVFAGRDADDIERARLRELAAAGIAVELGDLREPSFVTRVMAGCDAVIHLAAAQHEGHMSDEYFRSVNVGATRLMLEASREAGVRRFVYGSTMGIHGSSENGAISEESAPQPMNIYTRTKLAAEGVVGEFSEQLETAIVRIAETYGPGDLRLLKLFKAIDRGRFVMIGNGENRRQPIYVDDLIRGLLAALVQPTAVGQAILLTGNELMTTREMVGSIAAALERPTPHLRVPLWPMLAMASASHAVLRPLRIRSPLQPRSLDFFRKSFEFSTTKARRLLGIEPTTRFADGARATLDWYRAQGYIPDRSTTVASSTAPV
jgi:dihydroflavonol-4-reductase